MGSLLAVPIGLLPVIIFLVTLWRMDRHQLTPLPRVIRLIAAGMGAACVSLLVSGLLIEILPPDLTRLFLAPLIEEIAKAMIVVALFRASRIGFLVDAAILGFAVGAGFALAENLYLMVFGPPMGEGVWVVRGLGTAVMHGGVTAIFAIVAQRFTERSKRLDLKFFIPGLVMATALHWAFNQFYFSPLLHTLAVLVLLPLLLFLVFSKSADDLRIWMQLDFDADAVLIQEISSGQLRNTRAGDFLDDIRNRFPGEIVGDMLCYLRIYTELSLRAKGLLMMREHGMEPEYDPALTPLFDELRYLRESIGQIGVLALQPFLNYDRKQLWQLLVLKGQHRAGEKAAMREDSRPG